MKRETIIAPMTPSGVSAVAAIRISGSDVKYIIKQLFSERYLSELEKNKAILATAKHPKTKEKIDTLLFIFFEGPNSYTGEDVLELYPHGNPLIVKNLIEAIKTIDNVRIAEPGEFTQRAFLNGKMDLIQAESVLDVIHSATQIELKNAHRLLAGDMSRKIKELSESVKDISARLELDVDFAEEEADPDYDTWESKINFIQDKIQTILEKFKGKDKIGKLPLVVLYGAPNAGKSSLTNALIGEDRILVSEIPGTTRDFVEVRLFLPNGEIRLVDTAGIAKKAVDKLDALSMDKSKKILEEADLKLKVVDSCSLENLQSSWLNDFHIVPDIVVYSKCDLTCPTIKNADGIKELQISSKTGQGIKELKKYLNEILFKTENTENDLWITSEREKKCLEEALMGIHRIQNMFKDNPQVELLAFEMQLVRNSLQKLTGEISSEDVLQSIFARFCIGK